MRAILLAAGRGSRLSPYTDDRPKAMVELGSRPLFHYQLEVLNRAGIQDITVLTGYKGSRIAHPHVDFKRVENPRWNETNMVASLDCASSLLTGDVIVSYADIVYQTSVVETLLASSADISVLVDTGFRSYWEMRFDDPLCDVESLKMDGSHNIVKIGDKVENIDEVEAQYIGLMKFSSRGSAALRSVMDTLRSHKTFDGMYMTDLLRHMISLGHPVKAVPHHHGWLEIDTTEDLELMQRMLSDGSLQRFCDLGEG